MIIDVRDITGCPGASMELELNFTGEEIDITPIECEIVGEIYFTGKIEEEDRETLLLSGKLNGKIKDCCGRCGRETIVEIETPVNEFFAIKKKSKGGFDLSLNNEWDTDNVRDQDIYSEFNGYDLVPDTVFRENFLLAIPYKTLCSENCKGFCSTCGQNLNVKKCSCSSHDANGDREDG